MGYLIGVVGFKAIFQNFGETAIVTYFILFTDEDANIVKVFLIATFSLRSSLRFERGPGAAGVESEADIETIGIYEDLPNVCRMRDISIPAVESPLNDKNMIFI